MMVNQNPQYLPMNMMLPQQINQYQNQNPFIVMAQQQQQQQPQQHQQFYQFMPAPIIQQHPIINAPIIQQHPIMNAPIIQQHPIMNAPIIQDQGNTENAGNAGNEADFLINRIGNIGLNDLNKNKSVRKDEKKTISKQDKTFKQSKDGSNIIKSLYPLNMNHANFNNQLYPNETYTATFINDSVKEIQAIDINEYTLDTQKIIYNHNKSINQDNIKGTAVIYVRCSSANDISIETQITACLKHAKENSLILTGYYKDNGFSGRFGSNLKKGELGFWTQYLNNDTHFIVYSVDRLTRHLLSGIQYLDSLDKRNISTHFVNNKIIYNSTISAMHKHMVQQELQIAEKYSNDTSEKIKGTLQRLKNEGHCFGGRIPYGVKRIIVDGIRKQIPNPIEVDNMKLIKAKYYDIWKNFGIYSGYIKNKTNFYIINYIVKWCEEENIKHRNNQKMTENQIKTIIMKK
jgi:DNA invertase Pin-like site-specific DNA recombinase